jgi:hypothetical protein
MVEVTCSLSKEKPLPFHSFTRVPTISSYLAMPMHVGVMNISLLSGRYLEPQICFSLFKKNGREKQAFCGSRAMLRFVNVHSHFITIEFYITRLHVGTHLNFMKLKYLHHCRKYACKNNIEGQAQCYLKSTFQYWFNLVKEIGPSSNFYYY